MKRSIIAILSLVSVSSAFAEPMMCTMDYTPVCGKVQVQCIKAPCYPIYQTYGNKCGLNADKNATYVKDGECGSIEGAPAILSEKIRASLSGQYSAYFTKLSKLSQSDQIKNLDTLLSRIETRRGQILLQSAITVERRDMLLAALDLLKDLATNDRERLQNTTSGAIYVSYDSGECARVDFLCKTGTSPFSDVTGCGCKK